MRLHRDFSRDLMGFTRYDGIPSGNLRVCELENGPRGIVLSDPLNMVTFQFATCEAIAEGV